MKAFEVLDRIDRRVVYILVLFALSIPMIAGLNLRPAPMQAANEAFQQISNLEAAEGKLVLISLDYGPNSLAENLPQSEVVIEHLFMKNIPFILFSQYILAEGFLESVPRRVAERLVAGGMLPEAPVYGEAWSNIGFRPSGSIFLQGLASSDDIIGFLKRDARGNRLEDLPMFRGVKDIRAFTLVVQLTSLTGTLDSFLQFFQRAEYRPPLVHGCTAITIPAAYIYRDSGQITGLFEGVAGAAWYSELLDGEYPGRPQDKAKSINTGLGVAHLVIIAMIILGNLGLLLRRKKK